VVGVGSVINNWRVWSQVEKIRKQQKVSYQKG